MELEKGLTVGRVGLAEAIEALRSELDAAMTSGEGSRLRFEATEVHLTLEAQVTTSAGVHAGIKWWLIDAGGEGNHTDVATQTIALTLVPKVQDASGKETSPYLSGEDTRR